MEGFLENTLFKIGWFDGVVLIILVHSIIQCTIRGFTLSFITFLKWIVAFIITIFLFPKFQPWVSDYIDSPFINNFGLSIFIYFVSLFLIILIGKAFSSSIKWTGFGPLDRTFGFFFGVFRGYIVSVFIFTILNWFYPFNNWSIDVNNSLTFELIKKSSEILVNEFPDIKEFEDTKERIEKI